MIGVGEQTTAHTPGGDFYAYYACCSPWMNPAQFLNAALVWTGNHYAIRAAEGGVV